MKILKISALLIILLLTSCKKEDNQEAIQALTGHWHVLNFEPDNGLDITLMAKEVIEILEERGCDPIEFTFKSDGEMSYTNRMPLLSATEGGDGIEVDCIRDGGFRRGTFDFDYKKLILNFDNETLKYSASLDGEYMTIITNDMVLNGVAVSGKLIFKRETGD